MSSRLIRAWRRRPWLFAGWFVATVAVGGLGVLAVHLLADYEVLAKGPLLPHVGDGTVYEVRFGGWLTLYVDPEIHPRHYPDLLNGYLLTGVAFVCLTFAVILRSSGDRPGRTGFRFFVVAFAGFSYLVADELLGIHESIGHNMQFLLRLPLVQRPDDVLILAMAIPAGIVLVYFRSLILASRRATIAFAAAALGLVLAGISDVLALPIEKPLEILTSVCLLVAMLSLGLHLTRDRAPVQGSMSNSRSRR